MEADDVMLDSVIERAQLGGDGVDCLPVGDRHRLQLWGRLPPGWAGNLTLHTFSAGLHIDSGDAIRTREGLWAASFLLRSRERLERLRHDFLNMARRAPRLLPELPTPVVTIAAELSHDSPGHVYARVRGKDSVGLLADLLRRFAALQLQPRRFVLRTEGEEVRDWFWLEPSGPIVPSPADLAVLESDG
ncbi:MAG: hypothetical protein JRG86_06650 [Deltaproteobacteria bacterium]|nr:hypothetical protein [Deltaproteobacteria bacterium]MBW2501185.1 hypothetical protein [Deltaproteobacteria bacterium]